MVKYFAQEESGQGMVEYGLIITLVAIVVLGALKVLGQHTIHPMYKKLESIFPSL